MISTMFINVYYDIFGVWAIKFPDAGLGSFFNQKSQVTKLQRHEM